MLTVTRHRTSATEKKHHDHDYHDEQDDAGADDHEHTFPSLDEVAQQPNTDSEQAEEHHLALIEHRLAALPVVAVVG